MSHTELLRIPPTESAIDPIHSPADLRQRWRALMGPLGFGERLLRFSFVGQDRRMIKVLSDIPIGVHPEAGMIGNLMSVLNELVSRTDDGTTVAFLLTRPGRGPISDADREWATLLTTMAVDLDVPIEPIFRANDDAVLLVEPV